MSRRSGISVMEFVSLSCHKIHYFSDGGFVSVSRHEVQYFSNGVCQFVMSRGSQITVAVGKIFLTWACEPCWPEFASYITGNRLLFHRKQAVTSQETGCSSAVCRGKNHTQKTTELEKQGFGKV